MNEEKSPKPKISVFFDILFKVSLVVLIFLSIRSMLSSQPTGMAFYIVGGVALLCLAISNLTKRFNK